MDTTKTNFIKQYEPGSQARVELKNGRILDVVNGCYFEAGTRVILQDGKIEAMPGLAGEPNDITPDFSIDLEGKTVMPSLYNTHLHLEMGGSPTMVDSLPEMYQIGKFGEQQIENVVR